MSNTLQLLAQDNFIMYNIKLAKNLGVNEAILVGELARKYNYWRMQDRLTEDGYFFITQADIEEDTGLSPKQQRAAIKHLEEELIVHVTKKGGTDRSNYYKIDEIMLDNFLSWH